TGILEMKLDGNSDLKQASENLKSHQRWKKQKKKCFENKFEYGSLFDERKDIIKFRECVKNITLCYDGKCTRPSYEGMYVAEQSNEDFLLGINKDEFDLHDPDSNYNMLNDDSISSVTVIENLVIENTGNDISEISNVNASEIDNVSKNNEIEPLFVWDESAFEKAKMLADEKECNYDDEIEWEDLDYESSEIVLSTIQSMESLNYFLENNCGHLFQHQGSESQPFSCKDKHKDDTTQALKLLGQWILNVAASDNPTQKELLLTYLNSTLSFLIKLNHIL
ncbi:15108_t:CDS:2, partial [Cetraspora pellucida]